MKTIPTETKCEVVEQLAVHALHLQASVQLTYNAGAQGSTCSSTSAGPPGSWWPEP